MNNTANSERAHIGFFGRRNAGKSSLLNAVTGQDLAVVSDVPGTTTDPVKKAMELLPFGPVVIIDTPGIDDSGELGDKRVRKTLKSLSEVDLAVVCVDAERGISSEDMLLLEKIKERSIPYIIAYNKADLKKAETSQNEISVSAKTGENINELKEKIAEILKDNNDKRPLVSDLINANDVVLLVIPIDEAAPKGRLIMPQQQTIRDILDSGASCVACRDSELEETIKKLVKSPKLVITDSQVFGKVAEAVNKDIPLTSFSILFARYKGELDILIKGAEALDKLAGGEKILISEGCTHHRQCGDIGTVKLPAMIRKYTNKDFEFSFTSGGEFPEETGKYSLIVHCGGCMLNRREMHSRLEYAKGEDVPMTNYGVLIAKMNGILERSIEVFKKNKAL